jgi:IS5 family transposase
VLEGLRRQLESMVLLVQQVMRQTKARVFAGDTHAEGKIVSLFEPTTEVIREGKAGKPTEFGKWSSCRMRRTKSSSPMRSTLSGPATRTSLIAAIETHQARLGRTPRLLAADAGFYSGKNEAAAKAKGVKRVCIPKSPERNARRRSAGSANGQKWRDRFRGPHQRGQATAWIEPQSIQRRRRHEALGRPRRDRRQSGQHRRTMATQPGP